MSEKRQEKPPVIAPKNTNHRSFDPMSHVEGLDAAELLAAVSHGVCLDVLKDSPLSSQFGNQTDPVESPSESLHTFQLPCNVREFEKLRGWISCVGSTGYNNRDQ